MPLRSYRKLEGLKSSPPRPHSFCTLSSFTQTLVILLAASSATADINAENNGEVNSHASTSPSKKAEQGNKQHIFKSINGEPPSLDAIAKKLEDELKERQIKMREYWRQTFEEIKASNPVVFPHETSDRETSSAEKLFDRWKQIAENRHGKAPHRMSGNATAFVPDPLRFDGFQTWENQLQQWSDDVSLYLNKTAETAESQLNELLQPKETSSYDMSNFGIAAENLRNLTKSEDGSGSVAMDAKPEEATAQLGAAAAGQKLTLPRFGSDTNTPIGTLPIALTALDPNLPPLPKPRPVGPTDEIVPHTNIADKSKNIWIVTTAALPWMTGTAVNPLLRAAYLNTGRRDEGGSVTLMLPWVEREADQERVYGKEKMFESPDVQEQFIRKWLRETANMEEASEQLKIRWYTAWQEVAENSLYSMGDIIGLIPEEECDICVLEEPEHLNWYRAPGENWTTKYKHVVGIVHTNYFVYAQEQPAALIRAPGMRLLSSWMCRAHCHRLIKLSGTLGNFAPEKELIENVHGVRRAFLDTGEKLQSKLSAPDAASDPVFGPDASPSVYFIGKMLWSKGIGSLMDLMKYAEESAGLKVKVDMYGGGPNKDEALAKAQKMGLDMPFHGPIDHAELGWTHKVFINPSTSEVLCTTVAEALAMGKFVVLPSHPSNDFFAQFPNCLPYTNKEEFVGNLYYALTHSPEPMNEDYLHALSWEAATERFAAAGSVSVAEAEAMKEALSSTEAGLDIVLPPLITSEEQRKKITQRFQRTRGRYRNFRARLSQEISETNFLPKDLQQRLIADLDKRLDVDLDELLSSPKLRVKLSPAKLDKLLLELYDNVSQGPRGDVLRVIGGGTNVGMQHLYLKRQKSKSTKLVNEEMRVLTPSNGSRSISDEAENLSPTNLVKRALSRNFPQTGRSKNNTLMNLGSTTEQTRKQRNQKETQKMSLLNEKVCSGPTWGTKIVHNGSFTQYRPPRPRYSPLI